MAEICRRAGISQSTYFNWKKKHDGLLPTEIKRLKQLDDENVKLRKLVADLSLDKEMLPDVIRRKLSGLVANELVAETCADWTVSIRRPCRVLEFDTLTYHYKSRRRDQAGIEARIKDICATGVRYGYRRVHVMLKLSISMEWGPWIGAQLFHAETQPRIPALAGLSNSGCLASNASATTRWVVPWTRRLATASN